MCVCRFVWNWQWYKYVYSHTWINSLTWSAAHGRVIHHLRTGQHVFLCLQRKSAVTSTSKQNKCTCLQGTRDDISSRFLESSAPFNSPNRFPWTYLDKYKRMKLLKPASGKMWQTRMRGMSSRVWRYAMRVSTYQYKHTPCFQQINEFTGGGGEVTLPRRRFAWRYWNKPSASFSSTQAGGASD